MTVEEKTIEKLRKMLIADSTIKGYVSTRVYASHPSTIVNPVYPALSIHLLTSRPDYAARGFIHMNFQIDCWLPQADYDETACLAIQERLRALLDRQSITDTAISISGLAQESRSGPLLIHEEHGLLHLPTIFTVVAA